MNSGKREVIVEQKVLAKNALGAEENRAWLRERGVVSVNLISSPGSGKTTLLERTLEALHGRLRCGVIVGDLQTDNDARRLMGKGAAIRQIETVSSCHLDAKRIHEVLPAVVEEGTRLLIIENVGNLICPAAFDLGEDYKIALLSVTEGEDKPEKYPVIFSMAHAVVITKIDLCPHLDWDRERCLSVLGKVAPAARIFEVSAKSGAGMTAWLAYLMELERPAIG